MSTSGTSESAASLMGRALEPSSPRIDHPLSGLAGEAGCEVETVVLLIGDIVGRVTNRNLRRRPAPLLVVEHSAIHADHIVELIGVATLLRDEEDGGALVRDEALSIDTELVAFGFAA